MPLTVMSIVIEADLDQKLIERNNFTILDLLSDIGGLKSTIFTLLSFTVGFWNRSGLADSFLIEQLYTMKATGVAFVT